MQKTLFYSELPNIPHADGIKMVSTSRTGQSGASQFRFDRRVRPSAQPFIQTTRIAFTRDRRQSTHRIPLARTLVIRDQYRPRAPPLHPIPKVFRKNTNDHTSEKRCPTSFARDVYGIRTRSIHTENVRNAYTGFDNGAPV